MKTPEKKGSKPAAKRSPARRPPAGGKTDGEGAIRAKIALMPPAYRPIAERLHALIRANAPDLAPRTWYGMPAYAKEGEVVVFFRGPQVFKERYLTLGFNDSARLDDGGMWPVYYALTELTAADEARVGALVRKAVA